MSYSVSTSTPGMTLTFVLVEIDLMAMVMFRYGGYSSAGWDHGVRNFVFSSSDAVVAPETWIRLENGTTRAHVTLDNNYGR